jgi:hypothetical protein
MTQLVPPPAAASAPAPRLLDQVRSLVLTRFWPP